MSAQSNAGSQSDILIEQFADYATVTIDSASPLLLPLQDFASIRNASSEFSLSLQNNMPRTDRPSEGAAVEFIRKGIGLAWKCFLRAKSGPTRKLADIGNAVEGVLTDKGSVGDGVSGKGKDILRCEIVTNGSPYLPWEWLFGFEPTGAEPSFRLSTLSMGSVCWRRDSCESGHGQSILRSRPLQVRLFQHTGYEALEDELAFFQYDTNRFHLLGPIPEVVPDGSIDFAEQLFFHDRSIGSRASLPGGDQVVHITGHHTLDKKIFKRNDLLSLPFIDTVLELGDSEQQKIAVGDLEAKLSMLLKDARRNGSLAQRSTMQTPLVFLNSCRGLAHPWVAVSLGSILLDMCGQGVIVTVSNIPAPVAVTFSRSFYLGMLTDGMTPPEAIREATAGLLRSHSNPVGLLYTYVGNPEVRFDRVGD